MRKHLTPLLFCLITSIQTHASTPNVLFIVVDDLNDWVSHLGGHPQSITPNIDSLASRGVSFVNAHCVAPACNPSRFAVMSGLRPTSSGVYSNPSYWQDVAKDIPLIQEHFIASGYDAIAGGKIYHGEPGDWTDYWKRTGGAKTSVNKNGLNAGQFDWGPIEADDDGMAEHHLVDWAISAMNAERNSPLFLAVGFVKPHLPFYAPQKYFDRFPLDEVQLPAHLENDLDDLPGTGRKVAIRNNDHKRVTEADQWKKAVQGYLATVAFVDHQIGRLMKGFDQSPIADNTIIVLWSDHGWHLGEKQHWRKFALWNDTTRVPYFIIAPGVTATDVKSDTPVDLSSIYPTLCDLTGIDKPGHLDGTSILPLLKDPSLEWKLPAISTHGRGNHMIQTRHHRLIRYNDGSQELYDHRNDPHEWHNLAGDESNLQVMEKMSIWIPEYEAKPVPKNQALIEKRIARDKRLRELGEQSKD